ncbi:DUF3825 domain-containing protein [Thermomonospora cellulosilytica]|uniref:DUF3825 domain-containing protein n=1 Tax=Thermomonospora cellulosilytica TaxID=1411118 RepID=A0A7W3RC27_9ACTN|nr:DUF3825 domain-containing protein [Thermomonospora cellulosilytica]MBA9007652.1 hypothetical protein [Thermomonospora cellulosilytica]
MTLHESKPTAYPDFGRAGGRPPFGGTGTGTSAQAPGARPATEEASAAPGGTDTRIPAGPTGSPPGGAGPLPATGGKHGYLGEAPTTIPQAPAGPVASRRALRALHKHASLGPLRSDDPAGAAGDDFFDLLARLAEPEDWGGRGGDGTWVLREYVECAFERLYQQRQIVTAAGGTHSVFNTGLVTPQQEAIYGLFVPSRDPDGAPWQLQGWYPESERELQDRFSELPRAATYADDPAELVYDWRRDLVVTPRHLLESPENLAVLPAPLNSNPYQAGLVLEGAVRRAEARVRRDYRAAVPCWDPAAEEVRLLVPLSLTTPETVDTALVVTREEGQNVYRGQALLALDTAYARARQLARPHDWLRPRS